MPPPPPPPPDPVAPPPPSPPPPVAPPCSPGCNYQLLVDDECQEECNHADCAYDSGKCSEVLFLNATAARLAAFSGNFDAAASSFQAVCEFAAVGDAQRALKDEACNALANLAAGLDSLGFSTTQVGVLNWRVYDILLEVQLESLKSYDAMINFYETERTQYTLAKVQQGVLSSDIAGVGAALGSSIAALKEQGDANLAKLMTTVNEQHASLTGNIQEQTKALASALSDQTRTLISQSVTESNSLRAQLASAEENLKGA